MNTATQSVIVALFTLILTAGIGCSEKSSGDKASRSDTATQGALAPPPDANGDEAAKADPTFKNLALAAKVKADILKDASLRTSDIYVVAQDGTIVLIGTVDTRASATRAVEIAHSVADVRSVEDKLAVRSGG